MRRFWFNHERRCALLLSVWAKPRSSDADAASANQFFDLHGPALCPDPRGLLGVGFSVRRTTSTLSPNAFPVRSLPLPSGTLRVYPQVREARKELASSLEKQLDAVLVGYLSVPIGACERESNCSLWRSGVLVRSPSAGGARRNPGGATRGAPPFYVILTTCSLSAWLLLRRTLNWSVVVD